MVSGLAPRKFRMVTWAAQVMREKHRVTTAPPQMEKTDTYLTRSSCFIPRSLEIRLLAPRPKRFPSAVSRLNQGDTRETAATM